MICCENIKLCWGGLHLLCAHVDACTGDVLMVLLSLLIAITVALGFAPQKQNLKNALVFSDFAFSSQLEGFY